MSKQENNSADDSEDNFGLPEIDFKPLNRALGEQDVVSEAETFHQEPEVHQPEIETVVNETHEELSHEEALVPQDIVTTEEAAAPEETHPVITETSEEKPGSPVVVGIIIVALVAVALLLTYFFIYKPKADKAAAEKLANEKLVALKEKAKLDSIARVETEQKRIADQKKEEQAKPSVGTIETLSGPTGGYHVIATSNIDDDLVMDFAKKLSQKGVSSKIIPPFGKSKFYRLSIITEESFAKAQASAEAAKAEFGNSLWVIKY